MLLMKKTILYFLFLLVPCLIMAQSKNISIDWSSFSEPSSLQKLKTKLTKQQQKEKAINSTNLMIDEERLKFATQWKDNAFADPNSLRISNIRYNTLTPDEITRININLVPETFTATIKTTRARDIIYTIVETTPIIKDNGVYKKVLSFNITYSELRNRPAFKQPITNSVLATHNFFKFRIDRTGVHRITKNFLEDLGMNTNNINPQNLKVYGHGGKPLPLLNSLNTQFDLPETPVKIVGGEDGSFDSGDFLLFYGTSTEGYDVENDSFLNPYSDESYYYITADGGPGLRVQPMIEPSGNANRTFTSFHDTQFHEVDEESPSRLGRRWFGNRFDIENEQSYAFSFPNIINGEELDYRIKVIGVSETSTSMALTINGTSLNPITFTPVSSSVLIRGLQFVGQIPLSSEEVAIDLTYSNGGNPQSNAYIDYIRVTAQRALQGTSGQLLFLNEDADIFSGIVEYQISNAAQFTEVWDVTDPFAITSKLNENQAETFTFKATLGTQRKYVAVNPDDYFAPIEIAESRVVNQNLKGTIFNDSSGNFQDIDYLIIAPPFLLQPALRLANHHRNLSGLRVKVVTTDKIYEEFSSGKLDISGIRNFVKYVYDNASSSENRLKYLCLFGDTTIDYRDRLSNNNNATPIYHTLSSNSTVNSFMSDDFFGNMDPDEGTMSNSDRLDIAVGRILADNVQLGNDLVNKIINYGSQEAYGNWRNNFVLISDDVDEEYEYLDLEVTLDAIGDQIEAEKPFINVKKIHTDAFQQETSAGGDRYPTVNERIKDVIDVGSLIITYFGHGGEDGVAKEFIFTKDDGQNLQNSKRLPLLVTVTCEYTKFDNPSRITAGELIYWNREGGVISLITTTRSITVTLGVQFNQVLAPELFGYGTTNYNTPAEALRISKNQINDPLRRVVFYVGDPAMELAFPQPQVRLTTLNGQPIVGATDVLQALSKVTLGGEVLDANGNLQTDYTGVLEAKIFDKKVDRQTLGNDGVRGDDGQLLILDFQTLGEGIFNGQASVTNGLFEFEFVVPRDIQIPLGNGRASLYTKKEGALEDQTGVNFDLQIGGLNENAPEDNQGPEIQLFMNDESFTSGGITDDSPILIAKLQDENGLNTASGIGHDMIAILDGDEANPFVVNEYYQGDVDDFTKGTMNFKFRDLEEGLHTLTFKAWDVYNNSSTAELQFVVAGDDELKITRVLNYPNPFVNYTEFWFNHNRPLEPLEVQVQVFTVTGKVVWTKNQIITNEGFLSRDIVWDGRDDFGDKIGKGVYVYKITVKSSLTNKRVEKFEKLVIL